MKVKPRSRTKVGHVVGLDLSLTSTGMADEFCTQRIMPKGLSGPARLASIRDQILPVCRSAELVVIEGYSFASRNSQAHSLGELGGVVKTGLYEAGVTFIVVPPTVLKKVATGSGKADKNAVLVAAVKRLEYGGTFHDEADALWAHEIGRLKLGISTSNLPKAQVEAALSYFEKAEPG